MKTIEKYNIKEERMLFPKLASEVVEALEENPEQDFLGDVFMTLGIGNKYNGQFFTPYHVSKLMAAIAIKDIHKEINEKGYISVHDSCCGAGAMLIAGINEAKTQLENKEINFQNHILVIGQDIDANVAMMCYIQISLLGVAGYVKIGNSLTDPIVADDEVANYWFTPIFFSDIWRLRRLFRKLDNLTKPKEEK